MNYELKILNDPNDTTKIKEWIDIAFLSEPMNPDTFASEIEESVKQGATDLAKGIPYYFEDQNKIIAVLFAKRTSYDSTEAATITLLNIAVKENLQKQGIGTHLMEKAFQEMKTKGKKRAILFTTTGLGFYLKCGMTKWGAIPDIVPGKTRHYLYKVL